MGGCLCLSRTSSHWRPQQLPCGAVSRNVNNTRQGGCILCVTGELANTASLWLTQKVLQPNALTEEVRVGGRHTRAFFRRGSCVTLLTKLVNHLDGIFQTCVQVTVSPVQLCPGCRGATMGLGRSVRGSQQVCARSWAADPSLPWPTASHDALSVPQTSQAGSHCRTSDFLCPLRVGHSLTTEKPWPAYLHPTHTLKTLGHVLFPHRCLQIPRSLSASPHWP